MTHIDIMTQILHEVSGKPRDEIAAIVESGVTHFIPNPARLREEMPDEEAQRILSNLRKEKAGIWNWLLEGRRRAEAKLRRA